MYMPLLRGAPSRRLPRCLSRSGALRSIFQTSPAPVSQNIQILLLRKMLHQRRETAVQGRRHAAMFFFQIRSCAGQSYCVTHKPPLAVGKLCRSYMVCCMPRTNWIAIALIALSMPSICEAVDPVKLNMSTEKARKWILASQKDGNWEGLKTGDLTQVTGWTALAVDALLASGVRSDDPAIIPAIKYLQNTDTNGVYALGLRMQVWERLPASAAVHQAAVKDAYKLLHGIGMKGDDAGMYGYSVGDKSYSHSRSQYAVLGMNSAERLGIEVPSTYWKLVERGWIDHQLSDGGWAYKKSVYAGHPPTIGITTVGVATLYITAEMLHETESLDCRPTILSPAITRGLAWVATHSDEIANGSDTARNFPYANLYGVERAGAASGLKYFGDVNWFEKGAQWLMQNQKGDGHWASTGADDSDFTNFVDTSFAMLFLAHGQAPLMMQKLDYSSDPMKPSGWNRRPRDVANLARFSGQGIERDLSWATVNLHSPTSEYLEAPILFISGSEPLVLDQAAKDKLRDFIEDGGLIVGSAECVGTGFANAFTKLGTQITPYEFRPLPLDHPIFTDQQYPSKRWKTKPQLLGLSNGVRELMILSPNGDLGKLWEIYDVQQHRPAFELGADLFEYAGDREMRIRGGTFFVIREPTVVPSETIKVARLQYHGNWDPEPGGWRRLAQCYPTNRNLRCKSRMLNAVTPL